MLGYLYQVRVALLWSIRQSRIGDFSVSVETLDDVSFQSGGDPIAVLQTKHSIHATAGLGGLSPDLWKTLRIWMIGRGSVKRNLDLTQWHFQIARDMGLGLPMWPRPATSRALVAGRARA